MFWSGLILLFIFSVQLGWLPGPGQARSAHGAAPPFVTGMYTIDSLLAGDLRTFMDALSHLILPACVLGWAVIGIISRLVRASDAGRAWPGVHADRARQGRERARVLLNHALRNALIPTLTIVGFSFAYLITGAVLTETIFSWPGIGSYAVAAARALDYPAIIGVTIVGGAAFLLANLVTDLAYAVADPRVRLGSGDLHDRDVRAAATVAARTGLTLPVIVGAAIVGVLAGGGAERSISWAPYDAAGDGRAAACSRRAPSICSAPTRSGATCCRAPSRRAPFDRRSP